MFLHVYILYTQIYDVYISYICVYMYFRNINLDIVYLCIRNTHLYKRHIIVYFVHICVYNVFKGYKSHKIDSLFVNKSGNFSFSAKSPLIAFFSLRQAITRFPRRPGHYSDVFVYTEFDILQ